jgi:hypothetical protein
MNTAQHVLRNHPAAMLLNVLESIDNAEHNAFLLKQVARTSKTQRGYLVHATILMCNAQYAKLLLAHYKHEINARSIAYLEEVVKNF